MILKYQFGGAAPLVDFTPLTNPQKTATKSSSSSSDLSTKDLLELLEKVNGLPSDMNKIITTFSKLTNDPLDMLNTSSMEAKYLTLIQQINDAKFSSKQFEKVQAQVLSNGGINEVAVNERGQMICVNAQGDFKYLTIDKLKENKEYTPLTNSELLSIRAHNPQMAEQNKLLSVVANGIGMKGINEMITAITSKLGSTEVTKYGYTKKEKDALAGIELLKEAAQKGLLDSKLDAMPLEGIYKNKLVSKDQKQQILAAMDYIYATLPENAKTILKYKSDGTDTGAKNLIASLITSSHQSTYEFSTDLQDDPSGTRSNGKRGDEINLAMAFQQDMGVETMIPIVAGSTDALTIRATRLPVQDKEGKNKGLTTLQEVQNDSVFGGLFDFSQVTMGDQTLDMASTQNVVVDGSSIYKAYLPYDMNAAAKGVIKPDLDSLRKLEIVRNKIKETGAKSPEEINAIYQELGLPEFVTPDGKVNEQYYKPFGILNATALDGAFKKGVDLDSNYNFEEITDQNEIDNYWKIIKGKDSKEEFDADDAWVFEGDYNSLWKGLVYLPLISLDPTLAAYSGGDSPTFKEIDTYKTNFQKEERQKSFKQQGQLQL